MAEYKNHEDITADIMIPESYIDPWPRDVSRPPVNQFTDNSFVASCAPDSNISESYQSYFYLHNDPTCSYTIEEKRKEEIHFAVLFMLGCCFAILIILTVILLWIVFINLLGVN